MLEVRRLVLLRELSIRGTLSAVARAMNLAPSSVSEQLSLLERETKTQLLRRVGRNVQLTEAALALVSRVEPILDALEEAETALTPAGGALSGRVRLAAFQSAALTVVPSALSQLRSQHPDLRLEVVQYEPEQALHEAWARDFDVVVAEQYPGHSAPHWPGLDRRQLLQDELQLAVPADMTVQGAPETRLPFGGELEELLRRRPLPWVMEPRGTATRHWAEQLIRSAGHEPDVRFVSADLQAHVRLVESGNAMALLPGLSLVDHAVRLRRIPLAGRPRRTIFTSIRASSSRSPAVVAVREALQTAASRLEMRTDP